MSNRKSPNALIRQRYETGRTVVKRDEGRNLTQREFLDVAFGNNPRTGKPYNERTLRKWLAGERNASKAVEYSTSKTYSFQQRVRVEDQEYGPVLTKPSGASGLDLFTPGGRKRIRRAAKERLNARIGETPSKLMPKEYRPVHTTRGLKVEKARVVGRTKRPSVIITRKRRSPLRYTQAA